MEPTALSDLSVNSSKPWFLHRTSTFSDSVPLDTSRWGSYSMGGLLPSGPAGGLRTHTWLANEGKTVQDPLWLTPTSLFWNSSLFTQSREHSSPGQRACQSPAHGPAVPDCTYALAWPVGAGAGQAAHPSLEKRFTLLPRSEGTRLEWVLPEDLTE